MHRVLPVLIVVAAGFGLAHLTQAADTTSKEVDLFNGRDLSGWTCFLADPKVRMEDVWSVRDGILVCKGKPMGYLATKKDYTSFKLIVEWRWAPGQAPGNSGVLMRITGRPRALPKCVEAQLQSGSAGDVWGFHGFQVKGDAARRKTVPGHQLGGDIAGVERKHTNEKKPGEWNRYEITIDGGLLTLVINGKEVNRADGCDVAAGKIGLQSEGGEVHFRTVKLLPIGE